MPRRSQVQRGRACVQDLQRRNHRDEYSKKQCCDFGDGCEMKVIRVMNAFRRGVPRQHRHQDHDAFLYSARPRKVAAENRGGHDAGEEQKIQSAFNVNPSARLNFFRKRAVNRQVVLEEYVLIVEIEYHQQSADSRRPDRETASASIEMECREEIRETTADLRGA